MSILSFFCVLSASFALVLAAVAWKRNRESRLNLAVVLWALANVVWSGASAVLLVAPTNLEYDLALKVASVSYLCTQPLFALVCLTLAGTRTLALALIMAPELVICLLEMGQAVAGTWMTQGYRPGPWGNVPLPVEDPFWPVLGTLKGLYIRISAFLVLVLAFRRSTSRRFRSIVVQYCLWNAGLSLLAHFSHAVVWREWGYPNPMPALGILGTAFYFYLMVRYDHLESHRSKATYWFPRSVNDLILLTDGKGNILWIADKLAQLWGRRASEIEGSSLVALFPSRSDIAAKWAALTGGDLEQIRMEDEIQGRRLTLAATVERDRFGDVSTVLLRVQSLDPWQRVAQTWGLSPRELEIVTLLAQGYTNQQIASKAHIALATVKNHLHHIFEKTNTTSRLEVVRLFSANFPSKSEPNESFDP